jgi:hypothetical protein
MRVSTRGSDRGQVVPLVAVIVLLAGAAAVLVGDLGGRATARARARTAADAAALAGAAEGRRAADALARANGARLDGYEDVGTDTEVRVRIGDMTATARARRDGDADRSAPGAGPSGGGDRAGLDPAMMSALHRADLLLGRPVPVVSGYRSASEQAALWLRRAVNPYPVAAPGTSMHERGLAVDVPRGFVSTLLPVAVQAGLCQPLPMTDPVHFEPCQLTSPR